jgi:transposase
MKWNYFIGIDVSKNTLDCVVLQESKVVSHTCIENSQKSISSWIKSLFKLEGFSYETSLFCMEHTGIYNNPMLYFLAKKEASLCLESANQIKQSNGLQRGKSDKTDAERIAIYAFKNKDFIKLWKPKREVIYRLDYLSALRRRLLGSIKDLSNAIKSQDRFVDKAYLKEQEKLCRSSLKMLKNDLSKTEKLIDEVIASDHELKRIFAIVTSVEGVGPVTALEIILTTNEFKDIREAKKYACYAGVAPFENKSGISLKGRAKVSKFANKMVKSLLHMAALSAIKMKGEMKVYFDRKVTEGKNKMAVINAVRNKIILRIFACINQNRKYEKIYTNALA